MSRTVENYAKQGSRTATARLHPYHEDRLLESSMRSLWLYFLTIPIPIIILIALFVR